MRQRPAGWWISVLLAQGNIKHEVSALQSLTCLAGTQEITSQIRAQNNLTLTDGILSLLACKVFTRGAAKKPLRNDPYTTPPTNPVQLLQHIHLSRSINRLQSVLKQHRSMLQPVHMSAALTKLPKVVQHTSKEREDKRLAERDWTMGGELLTTITQLATPMIPKYEPRQLANNLWALGQVKRVYPAAVMGLQHALVQELAAEHYSKMFTATNPMDTAQLASGAERLGIRDPVFWEKLERLATRRAGDANMTALQVTILATAFAKTSHATPELLAALARRGSAVALYFRPATAAPTLAAYVKTSSARNNVEFMGDLMEIMTEQIATSRTEHLAQAIYASATLRRQVLAPPPSAPLASAASLPAPPQEADTSAAASDTAASSGTAGQENAAEAARNSTPSALPSQPVSDPQVLRLLDLIAAFPPLVAAQSVRKLEHFSSAALAELLLGLAHLGHHDAELMEAVAAGIAGEERLYADRRVMAGIIHAFAVLKHTGESTRAMCRRLCEVLGKGVEGLKAPVATVLLRDLGELRYRDETFVGRLAGAAMSWEVGQQVEVLEAMRKQGYQEGRTALVEALVAGVQRQVQGMQGDVGYVMAELACQEWRGDLGVYEMLGARLLQLTKSTGDSAAVAGVVVLRTLGKVGHWSEQALVKEAEGRVRQGLRGLSGYWLVQAVAALSTCPMFDVQLVKQLMGAALDAAAELGEGDLLLLLKAYKGMQLADTQLVDRLGVAAKSKQHQRVLAEIQVSTS